MKVRTYFNSVSSTEASISLGLVFIEWIALLSLVLFNQTEFCNSQQYSVLWFPQLSVVIVQQNMNGVLSDISENPTSQVPILWFYNHLIKKHYSKIVLLLQRGYWGRRGWRRCPQGGYCQVSNVIRYPQGGYCEESKVRRYPQAGYCQVNNVTNVRKYSQVDIAAGWKMWGGIHKEDIARVINVRRYPKGGYCPVCNVRRYSHGRYCRVRNVRRYPQGGYCQVSNVRRFSQSNYCSVSNVGRYSQGGCCQESNVRRYS